MTHTVQSILDNGGKPPSDLTNRQWLLIFNKLKSGDFTEIEIPETTDEWFEIIISDILDTIRNGKCDYCYNLYQIIRLLEFESGLQSSFIKDCGGFKVWL